MTISRHYRFATLRTCRPSNIGAPVTVEKCRPSFTGSGLRHGSGGSLEDKEQTGRRQGSQTLARGISILSALREAP